MELKDRERLLRHTWNSFEKYPKYNENIMLHVIGNVVGENRVLHDFVPMRFNAKKFDPADHIKQRKGVQWKFSWLPLKQALTGNGGIQP